MLRESSPRSLLVGAVISGMCGFVLAPFATGIISFALVLVVSFTLGFWGEARWIEQGRRKAAKSENKSEDSP